MLFDVIYGWRKWQEQRGFWGLLIISLCMFCCLIGLVVNLFWLLSSDRPQWVNNQAPMLTIAKKDLSGNIQPTAGYNIDLLKKIAGVEAVTSIAVQSGSITLGLKELPRVTIGFYSQNTIEMLGLAAPFSSQNLNAKAAIVSNQFWQQHLKSSLKESSLYYQDRSILIKGVAPQAMKRLGDIDIDIWLPESYLELGIPEMFADNPQLFLKTKGNRYGFALLSQGVDIELLQDAYMVLRQQTPWPDNGFADKHYSPWLIAGVELNPNGRDILYRQASILLLLLLGFGFIIFSGIVSAYSQQGITRQAEMRLKLALGGSRRGLMAQLFRESFPALLLVGFLSPLLGIVVIHYVGNIGDRKSVV